MRRGRGSTGGPRRATSLRNAAPSCGRRWRRGVDRPALPHPRAPDRCADPISSPRRMIRRDVDSPAQAAHALSLCGGLPVHPVPRARPRVRGRLDARPRLRCPPAARPRGAGRGRRTHRQAPAGSLLRQPDRPLRAAGVQPGGIPVPPRGGRGRLAGGAVPECRRRLRRRSPRQGAHPHQPPVGGGPARLRPRHGQRARRGRALQHARARPGQLPEPRQHRPVVRPAGHHARPLGRGAGSVRLRAPERPAQQRPHSVRRHPVAGRLGHGSNARPHPAALERDGPAQRAPRRHGPAGRERLVQHGHDDRGLRGPDLQAGRDAPAAARHDGCPGAGERAGALGVHLRRQDQLVVLRQPEPHQPVAREDADGPWFRRPQVDPGQPVRDQHQLLRDGQLPGVHQRRRHARGPPGERPDPGRRGRVPAHRLHQDARLHPGRSPGDGRSGRAHLRPLAPRLQRLRPRPAAAARPRVAQGPAEPAGGVRQPDEPHRLAQEVRQDGHPDQRPGDPGQAALARTVRGHQERPVLRVRAAVLRHRHVGRSPAGRTATS